MSLERLRLEPRQAPDLVLLELQQLAHMTRLVLASARLPSREQRLERAQADLLRPAAQRQRGWPRAHHAEEFAL